MSTSRTFTPYVGGGAGGAVQVGDPWTDAEGEEYRQNVDLLAYLVGHFDLGGDERPMTITTPGTWQAVNGARTYDLNGDSVGGMTLEAVLFYYTSSAGTTVDVRLRNTTDSTNAATLAAASASTTVVRTARTVTLASGIKTYQLQWDASNTSAPVYVWGMLRLRKVPA